GVWSRRPPSPADMRLMVLAALCVGSGVGRPRLPTTSQHYSPTQFSEPGKSVHEPELTRDLGPIQRQGAEEHPSTAAIVKDMRIAPARGVYNMEVETGNGIRMVQHVESSQVTGGSVSKGGYYFTHPDGTVHQLTYVADENGYQPSSDMLPVAPINPHPMPAHALQQIEKAKREDELKAREAEASERYKGREEELLQKQGAPQEALLEQRYPPQFQQERRQPQKEGKKEVQYKVSAPYLKEQVSQYNKQTPQFNERTPQFNEQVLQYKE
ncbi:hypothetical protein OTU49_009061, partial [Cherax quadricarinatus]